MSEVVLLLILLAAVTICFRLFLVGSRHLFRNRDKWLEIRLKRLPFFHQLYIGACRSHDFWENGEHKYVHADAPYLVVVKKEDQVIGMVGFDLTTRSLRVRQLQGIKGRNVKGIDLASYLLECAEKIAFALHLNVVKVQLAQYNFYYDLDEDHPLYPKLFSHRERLARIYDKTPRSRGYELSSDMRWQERHVI